MDKKLFAPPQNQLRNNLEEEESSQEFVQLQSVNNTDESEVEKEHSLKVSKSSEKKNTCEKHANSTLRITSGELWGRDFSDVGKVQATLSFHSRPKSGNYPNSAPRVFDNLLRL